MELCSDNHDEVCHAEKKCPACELAEAIVELEKQIARLEKELQESEV